MQQINLYKLLPKEAASLLSQKKVIIYYAIFILLLIILYSHNDSQKRQMETDLNVMTDEISGLQNQSIQLAQKYPTSNPEELQKLIKDLQKQWDNKVAAVDILVLNANFSSYLTGLASATSQGVWYTEIDFNRGLNNINLKGLALQAVLLTGLMDQLAKPSIFHSFSFNLKEVNEDKLPAIFNIVSKRAQQT
ncbi:MAG TPA: hypothetical protein VHM20_06700 [Gammaproteobacteria bacterium]|jgi:hypothetical protein|nr:hypothetical protein [Gammaproteobacteria bacterium]